MDKTARNPHPAHGPVHILGQGRWVQLKGQEKGRRPCSVQVSCEAAPSPLPSGAAAAPVYRRNLRPAPSVHTACALSVKPWPLSSGKSILCKIKAPWQKSIMQATQGFPAGQGSPAPQLAHPATPNPVLLPHWGKGGTSPLLVQFIGLYPRGCGNGWGGPASFETSCSLPASKHQLPIKILVEAKPHPAIWPEARKGLEAQWLLVPQGNGVGQRHLPHSSPRVFAGSGPGASSTPGVQRCDPYAWVSHGHFASFSVCVSSVCFC